MNKNANINGNRLVIAMLVVMFAIYNFLVYSGAQPKEMPKMNALAIKGQQLYQDNNCTACHQLYGLGGYLGPDLTNVISTTGKGEMYVKAFLNSGVKSMPKFNFTEEEKNALVEYLSAVDKTGYFPNYEAEKKTNGWVKIKTKIE
jgi:nitric oxide reductase subunit C